MLITISNLFPRPDQPTRGLYNFYLFREMAGELLVNDYLNICLVPEWRVWRWPAIRKWTFILPTAHPGLHSLSDGGCSLPTVYLPVFYLPLLGRSLNWWFYYRALRGKCAGHDKSHAPVWGGCPHPPGSRPSRKADEDIRPTEDISPATPTCYVPWLYPDGVAVARAIRGTGARLWLMALGSDTFHLESRSRRRRILDACAQAEGIVCVAQVLADRLAAAGVSRAKLHVVPNGVDASMFRVRSQEELLVNGYELNGSGNANNQQPITDNSPSGTPDNRSPMGGTILFVGNLVPVKGPDILLKAFAALGETEGQVAAAVPAADGQHGCEIVRRDGERHLVPEDSKGTPSGRLLLIGSGPMRARLESMARDLGIVDRVHFLGRRSREEVALWMNRADVLCLSSRSEGMPNVVLEARASGLPVVTTPAGAIPELPLNQDHFLVVKSCRPEDLAEGLRAMLGRDLSRRVPDPAIASWGQMAGKILKLLTVQE